MKRKKLWRSYGKRGGKKRRKEREEVEGKVRGGERKWEESEGK